MRTLLLVATVVLLAHAAGAVDVVSCGQFVGDKEIGTLPADLDCTAQGHCAANESIACDDDSPCPGGICVFVPAVIMGRRATLELNGHTISLHPGRDGVDCEASKQCTVQGPGSIDGGRIAVTGGSSTRGVKLKVFAVNITGAAQGIAEFRGTIDARNVHILNGQIGLVGSAVRLTDAEVSGHSIVGVHANQTARAVRLVATGSPVGVFGHAIGITDSTVTGNGVDLQSFRRPAVRGTSTCGTSQNYLAGGTWGVCTAD